MRWEPRFITPEAGRSWLVDEATAYSIITACLRYGHTIRFRLQREGSNIRVMLKDVSYDSDGYGLNATPMNYLDIYLTPALAVSGATEFCAQTSWFWVDDDPCGEHLGRWIGESF